MREQSYRRTPDGSYEYEKIMLPTIAGAEGRVDIAVIDDERLMSLPEYSLTNPTGVFVNKMWRRGPPPWHVCEYVPHPTRPDLCRTTFRLAASPEAIGLAAEGILWFLPC